MKDQLEPVMEELHELPAPRMAFHIRGGDKLSEDVQLVRYRPLLDRSHVRQTAKSNLMCRSLTGESCTCSCSFRGTVACRPWAQLRLGMACLAPSNEPFARGSGARICKHRTVMCCGVQLQALPTSRIARAPSGLELRADAVICCAVQARTTTRPQDFISSLAEAKPHLKVSPGVLHALYHWWPGDTLQSLL